MDRSVTNFNTRLRTIRIRDLIVGVLIAGILLAILMEIFPDIYGNSDLSAIVFVVLLLLLFAWALKGTTGLNADFGEVFEKDHFKEMVFLLYLM